MTRMPPMAAPELTFKPDDTITEVRTYDVITPLFGGGVEPAQADPISVVRASEVRGQLRFWWRATRGGQFGGDLQAMRNAELALWGGAARFENGQPVTGQSLVQVVVEPIARGYPVTTFPGSNGRTPHIGDPGSLLSYGAFPLRETGGQQGQRRQGAQRSVLVGVSFQLMISFPAERDAEVQSALWAWESFGGLGARTRRGFGALKLIQRLRNGATADRNVPRSDKPKDLGDWYAGSARAHIIGSDWHPDIPHLSPDHSPVMKALPDGFNVGREDFEKWMEAALIHNRVPRREAQELLPALVAWYYPIFKLQQFRQSRRRNNNSRFGRSYWPEPDEIRQRTTGFNGRHSDRLTGAPKFPRAVFGLPIVFKFKDEAIDPPQTILQGARHDRLSSRLVLRPIACANGSYVAAAVVLAGPDIPPGGLRLEGARVPDGISTDPLTTSEANFRPLNGNTDVIAAYLDTL